jgi:hypothetical protein
VPSRLRTRASAEGHAHALDYQVRKLDVAHVPQSSQADDTGLDPYRMVAGLLKNWQRENAVNYDVVLRGDELHLIPSQPGFEKRIDTGAT